MEIHEYPKRSIEQHNTEWLYYQIIANATGNKPYDIYENMAMRILKVVCEDGEIGYVKPTSLNSYQHNLYMEQIRQEAAEFDIILPDPTTDISLQHETKKFRKDGSRRK